MKIRVYGVVCNNGLFLVVNCWGLFGVKMRGIFEVVDGFCPG